MAEGGGEGVMGQTWLCHWLWLCMSNQKVYMTAAPSALNRPNELEPRQRSASAQTSRQSVSPPLSLLPPAPSGVAKIVACAACVGQVKVLDSVTQTGSY